MSGITMTLYSDQGIGDLQPQQQQQEQQPPVPAVRGLLDERNPDPAQLGNDPLQPIEEPRPQSSSALPCPTRTSNYLMDTLAGMLLLTGDNAPCHQAHSSRLRAETLRRRTAKLKLWNLRCLRRDSNGYVHVRRQGRETGRIRTEDLMLCGAVSEEVVRRRRGEKRDGREAVASSSA